MQIDPAISWTIALSVATLFAVAAIQKATAWSKFRAVLRNYELLPDSLDSFAVGVLIALEGSAAVLMIPEASRTRGALLSVSLLATYAGAMAINLLRGRVNLDCGCLGVGRRQPIRGWMVGRNVVIAALALLATMPTTPRALGALDAVTVMGAVLSLAILYAAYNLLRAAPHSRRESA
jgi:Methylamine utilisation protein MauE